MTQRTTDVQLFDELATEAEERSRSPQTGRSFDTDLIETVERKLTNLMGQPPEAYNKLAKRCHLTEIDDAIRSEFFSDKPWDHAVRREFFAKQIALIATLRTDEVSDSDALLELAAFLRMVVIGLEKYLAHVLRR